MHDISNMVTAQVELIKPNLILKKWWVEYLHQGHLHSKLQVGISIWSIYIKYEL